MTEPTVASGFKRLALARWRQFEDVEINFHPRLTVLTGANAVGKSTILALLGRHFNWPRQFASSPLRREESGTAWETARGLSGFEEVMGMMNMAQIGILEYRDGTQTPIAVPHSFPTLDRTVYDALIVQAQTVNGAFLSSHRSIAGAYSQIESVPTKFRGPDQLFDDLDTQIKNRHTGSYSPKTPHQQFKESLISVAIFGNGGNEFVERNEEAALIWTGYLAVLAELLPETLGFQRMRVREDDVIVECESGDFILDEASGGISSILEMGWQIFLRSRSHSSFTVLLDEPENHLHPSLQRQLVRNLLAAFPNVQFIVATHSPFMVTATPDSAVYALLHSGPNRRVVSQELDYANKATNADETLRRVLGLESTMPVWAEVRFDEIVQRHLGDGFTKEAMAGLREELVQNGLESQFPVAVLGALRDEGGESAT